MHGESALFIARTFYKTTAVVKYAGGANGLPGVLLGRAHPADESYILVPNTLHQSFLITGASASHSAMTNRPCTAAAPTCRALMES